MMQSDINYNNISQLPGRLTSSIFQNRDVQRAGWLKYIPFAEKASSENHKFWVVFAVYDEATPYLEFYQQRQIIGSIFSDGPVSKHSLLNCRHISSVITLNKIENHNEFTITLETHVIRLAADTEEVMFDWINTLKSKLGTMNILNTAENLYSSNPSLSNNFTNNINSGQQNVDQSELYEPIFDVSQNLSSNLSRISLGDHAPLLPLEEGPPPYELIFNHSNAHRATVSFRESQVEKLKKEMELITGLTLKVRRKDCYNAIAFVDILTYGIFIGGWKQKDHPHLHNTFHIGDQLISINGVAMENAAHARDFIKQCSHSLEVTIRRIPYGQVFCLKRSFDGEDLGLIREKGTAEISQIVPDSIAARAGLLSKCSFYNDLQESNNNFNWFLTEINNRPLNYFFKNNEVADRLSAIGKEISILVQPCSFVKRIRKQLKYYKNYKDYIVQ